MADIKMSAEEWNASCPVGTPVAYRSWHGAAPVSTRTRSEAWELGSGDAVVLVEGKSGGVALFALEVLHG